MQAEAPGAMHVAFADLIDLAAAKVGGKALLANDEFFAPKEAMLEPGRGVFIADKYTERGKWMDGWETRRKRVPGYDWCIVKLGLPGAIHGIDVDTNHFIGNFPEYASLEACEVDGDPSAESLAQDVSRWTELVPRSRLRGGSRNLFAVANERRFTHVRLNIFPDGGVARLRVHGMVLPDWHALKTAGLVDLAAAANGGSVVTCNDQFFGTKDNLIFPGRAANMGEGWETRRKRVPGFDWIVVKLATAGTLRRAEVDTHFFKGNFPDRCSLEGIHLEEPLLDFANATHLKWKELLPQSKLQADHCHVFDKELKDVGPITHVRLNIFPDGGVSRLRLFGEPA
ncbi:allantoicase [Corallococcus praedator]|uniref:Probable allantoicase n=1 Tax=Corallococcus praedator TaxID=2316724 RepID=A0ABX9QA49_9BACT|nr:MULTISPECIES: allantoicase [Corallococcus]RKH06148.1 allantoicase [Corallococcus sp. CA047B]RKH22568.1 allantoicase [Corallococcus sp. CA031C]RKH96324.1 allantoicase [Corallococcus praedator]